MPQAWLPIFPSDATAINEIMSFKNPVVTQIG
jgi:hypothetical protein